MNKMIDIHTHLIPFVDDGACDFDESLSMIERLIEDGVSDVIITPHNQSVVTKKDRDEQKKLFQKLNLLVKEKGFKINLHLGSELRYRSHLTPNYKEHVLGNSKYLLLEFSTRKEEPIEDLVYNLSRNGYKPIIAHIERYPYLKFKDYNNLRSSGALIQVNANAVLGEDGKKIQRLVLKMLKDQLIDFIASDTHNLEKRPPNLKEAYKFLENKIDKEYLDKLFYLNAKMIIEWEFTHSIFIYKE